MKTVDKSSMTTGILDDLTSKFSINEILSECAMQRVRGGNVDGGADLIIIPKPPQP